MIPHPLLIRPLRMIPRLLLIRPLREAVLREAMPRFAEGLRIERAMLGNDAGMIGAVSFWLTCHGAERQEQPLSGREEGGNA